MPKGGWRQPLHVPAVHLAAAALLAATIAGLGYLLACGSRYTAAGTGASWLLWQQPRQAEAAIRGQHVHAWQQHPQPLLMFITSRSGSSFMTEVLNLHSKVLFESERFNQPAHWQGETPPALNFFKGAYRASYESYRSKVRAYSAPAKDYEQLAAVGFKVRPSQAELQPGSGGWRALQQVQPKLICSYRRNAAKAAISEVRAAALGRICNTANLSRHVNCTLPSNWTASPAQFQAALRHHYNATRGLLELCYRAAEEWPTIFVAYEDLLADVPLMVGRMLRFAGIQAADRLPFIEALQAGTLPIALDKNTPDDLRQLFSQEKLQQLADLAAQVVGGDIAASLVS